MAHLLHLDASPRNDRSHSRRLTKELIERWCVAHPDDTLTYRDIGRNPLPHVTEEWIAAAFTSPEKRSPSMRSALALSDELVDELFAADVIVAGIPFYNFGMPSGFKAYIDQIVRVGRTFAFHPDEPDRLYEPLTSGKRLIAVIARGDGGYGPGGRNAGLNHLDPHLRTVFGFIGITEIDIVAIENDEHGGTALADSIIQARESISRLVDESQTVTCTP